MSAITTDIGSCGATGATERAYHILPPTSAAATMITPARIFKPTTRLTGIVQTIELGLEFNRRLKSLLWIRFETTGDQRIEGFGDRRLEAARRRQRPFHARSQFGQRALRTRAAAEAQERVVENQPERVDVRALIDLSAQRLLWRHVFNRADGAAGLGLSD